MRFLWIACFCLFSTFIFSQNSDSLSVSGNNTKADSIKVPKVKNDISDIINYNSIDSIWFDIAKQEVELFGKAHVDYDNIIVDAPKIRINLKNSTMEALSKTDSNGKVLEWAVLQQGDDKSQAKTVIFNYKTNRGYIEDVYTQEGEGYLHTKEAYLDEHKNMYLQHGAYTTCNLAEPHYHFGLAKAKVIPDDKIVGKFIQLYIDSIPTPLGLPFGIFPSQKKRQNGFLLPTYNTQGQIFSLQGFGYFWAINDSLTTQLTSEIYANGSFGLTSTSNYNVRYKHSGRLSATYRSVRTKADEYNGSLQQNYRLQWSHDPVSRGGRRLSADVNFENSSFNQFNFRSIEERQVPAINSSITWNLPLKGLPFNAVISAKHSQNKSSNDGLGTNIFNIPNFTLNYSGERNPYKLIPYSGIKPSKFRQKILDQIAISYSTSGNNLINSDRRASLTNSSGFTTLYPDASDSVSLELKSENFSDLLKRNKFYMTHSASIQSNVKIKYFTLTPFFNYSESWYFSRSNFDVNSLDKTISYDNEKGFFRNPRYSSGANLSTTFYNFYTLGKSKKKTVNEDTLVLDRQIKFRQQITPTIGYSSSPQYNVTSDIYEIFVNGNDSLAFNRFFLYNSQPGISGKSQSINFSLNNIFELKTPISSKKQLDPNYIPVKKEAFKLLQLNATASYNMAADSLKLSNIGWSASNTNLFKGRLGFTVNGSLDPYQYDSIGTVYIRTNEYWVKSNKSLARLSRVQVSSNFRVTADDFKKKKNKSKGSQMADKMGYFYYPNYLDFSMPWTLAVGHTFLWDKVNPNSEIGKTNAFTFSGSLKLSEKWNSDMRVNFDLNKKEFNAPNIGLNRDMHCWVMRLQWTPFDKRGGTQYSFYIGVKADMLKDLKYEKRNSGYDRIRQ